MLAVVNSYARSAMVERTRSLMLCSERSADDRRTKASRFLTIFPARTASARICSRSRRSCCRCSVSIEELRESEDGLQGIVQLVGDTRHELPDRRKTFAVDQLIAEPRLFRDVPLHPNKMRDDTIGIGQRDDRRCRGKRGAILPATQMRAAPDTCFADSPIRLIELSSRFFGNQLIGVHADELFQVVSESSTKRLVGMLDPKVLRDDDDQFVGMFHSRGQQLCLGVGFLQLRSHLVQLRSLDGKPCHQQRQDRNDRDRGRQVAESTKRIRRVRRAKQVVDQRNECEATEDHPGTRRRLVFFNGFRD